MKLQDLNEEQRLFLKQAILIEARAQSPSYDELAHADLYVTDEYLEMVLGNVEFCEEDFGL